MDVYLLVHYPPFAPGYKVEGWSDNSERLGAEAQSRNTALREQIGADYRSDLFGRYAVLWAGKQL